MNDISPSRTHVRCAGLAKSFGSVRALRHADLHVEQGRITALVGENGAGKSTLMHLISGDLEPEAGVLEVHGPVGLVKQQLSTIGDLTLLENIVFGAERKAETGPVIRALGAIPWRAHRANIRQLMERTGLNVPLRRLAREVSVGVRQRADILAALYRGARCLLLDEPTTYLTPHEVDGLFGVMRGLAADGFSVVFISHRLREVAQNCDDVSVLRRGETVLHLATPPFDLNEVGRAMSGGTAEHQAVTREQPSPAKAAPIRLDVAHGDLRVRSGEIVGIAGVSGNGQNQLLDSISGISHHDEYAPIVLDGEEVTRLSARSRRASGLHFVPESVKESGVALTMTITDNVMTANPSIEVTGKFGLLRRDRAEGLTANLIDRARVVTSGPRQLAGELSGGNLQRVVVTRELNDSASVLLAHEPSRGVDFAGVALIHQQLTDFVATGGAVLLLSSDIDELLGLSDRIHVIDRGRLSRSYPRDDLDIGRLGELLGGLEPHPETP